MNKEGMFSDEKIKELFETMESDPNLMKRRESSILEYKESFNWANKIEYGKMFCSLVNCKGGYVIFGVKSRPHELIGLQNDKFSNKDTSEITQYLNEHFSPSIEWHSYEHEQNGKNFGLIYVVKSEEKPVICIKQETHTSDTIREGEIYYRYSGETKVIRAIDLQKIINERIEREIKRGRNLWLSGIRKVISAPPGYKAVMLPPNVKESELLGAPPTRFGDDPNLPVFRKAWDESPYESPQEIVVGILKSWKHDRTSYASESDMWTLYKSRENLKLDEEKAECLLESAINRYTPFFFWAKLLSTEQLKTFICRVIHEGKYPALNRALKLAHAIGGEIGVYLLDLAATYCGYSSVKCAVTRLKKTVTMQGRIKTVYGTKVKIGLESISIDELPEIELKRFLDDALADITKNKVEIKKIDALIYAPGLES
ncbi:MAG: ATP-binding protein [Candidatus Stahlbacteria bacterium]|nr:ATP-binding protein [Candidatus Stahlbacteria bacterium]